MRIVQVENIRLGTKIAFEKEDTCCEICFEQHCNRLVGVPYEPLWVLLEKKAPMEWLYKLDIVKGEIL